MCRLGRGMRSGTASRADSALAVARSSWPTGRRRSPSSAMLPGHRRGVGTSADVGWSKTFDRPQRDPQTRARLHLCPARFAGPDDRFRALCARRSSFRPRSGCRLATGAGQSMSASYPHPPIRVPVSPASTAPPHHWRRRRARGPSSAKPRDRYMGSATGVACSSMLLAPCSSHHLIGVNMTCRPSPWGRI